MFFSGCLIYVIKQTSLFASYKQENNNQTYIKEI